MCKLEQEVKRLKKLLWEKEKETMFLSEKVAILNLMLQSTSSDPPITSLLTQNSLHTENFRTQENLEILDVPTGAKRKPAESEQPSDFKRRKIENMEGSLSSRERDLARFLCTICKKRYKSKQFLAEHMRRHSEATLKPYQCQQCDKKFMYKAGLSGHVLATHKKINHPCEGCGKVYAYANKKRLHQRKCDSFLQKSLLSDIGLPT